MVTTLQDFPADAYTMVIVSEDREDPPSPAHLDGIDEAVAKLSGYAFRFAVSDATALRPRYEYGYVLPRGSVNWDNDFQRLKETLADAGVDNPLLRIMSVWFDGEELDKMELVGHDPQERFAALKRIAEDLDRYMSEK